MQCLTLRRPSIDACRLDGGRGFYCSQLQFSSCLGRLCILYIWEVFPLTLVHGQHYPNQRTCAWGDEKLGGLFHPVSTGFWLVYQFGSMTISIQSSHGNNWLTKLTKLCNSLGLRSKQDRLVKEVGNEAYIQWENSDSYELIGGSKKVKTVAVIYISQGEVMRKSRHLLQLAFDQLFWDGF